MMGGLHNRQGGFTLIELSIVLVIIGLIVGGVLVGQNLINAAAVRAQVSQIEKYNTAANTFREKYGYLPGDIKDPDASNFGFLPRGQYAGEGDGNGVLQGITANAPASSEGHATITGELGMFWVDLSTARLIDGNFNTVSPAVPIFTTVTETTNPPLSAYLPRAKLGGANYVYVWSADPGDLSSHLVAGPNNFAIAATASGGAGAIATGMTVQQAFAIDTKMDDGLPQLGNVRAAYLPAGGAWAAGGGNTGTGGTAATPSSATTCFDNGNTNTATQQYSVGYNGGSNVNCALSFKMQAGD